MPLNNFVEKIIRETITPDSIDLIPDDNLSFRVWWYLGNNAERKHKQSKNIIIVIPEEYIKDYLQPQIPISFSINFESFLKDKIFNFQKESDHKPGEAPFEEKWVFC